MSALNAIEQAEVSVVDGSAPFFAPTPTDLIDGLLAEYRARRLQIDELAAVVGGSLGNVMHYFLEGNAGDESTHRSLYVARLFEVEGAVHALDGAYWSRLLALTDVYEFMPQERKNAWNKQIKHPAGIRNRQRYEDRMKWESEPLPAFEESTVRATIQGLLAARGSFLAEKVDGIFRSLSGNHVTNAPEAFGKRMIIAGVLTGYGTWAYERVGYLHDLRCVIAKFMGRDEPKNQGPTQSLVDEAQHRRGKWVVCDGGALKIRVYKCGTAHMEVHPDMAWRLNQILAYMHPMAIPAEFRQKPRRKAKDVPVIGRPLPFAVLELLSARQYRHDNANREKVFCFDSGAKDKGAVYDEACRVLESIGGTRKDGRYEFDYSYREVLSEILTSGCIPDQKAHQFYPTPEKLARIVVDQAEIGETDRVLEPSAGQGGIADHLPKDRTVCVEVSALHCAVLKAKGLQAIEADFVEWAAGAGQDFDVVAMNPPFADGRAQLHIECAGALVRPGGRLVAILPASMRGKQALGEGWNHQWSAPYDNEFAGTSVSVVILKATRSKA